MHVFSKKEKKNIHEIVRFTISTMAFMKSTQQLSVHVHISNDMQYTLVALGNQRYHTS